MINLKILSDLKYFQTNNRTKLAQVEEQAIKSYLIARLEQMVRSKIPTN